MGGRGGKMVEDERGEEGDEKTSTPPLGNRRDEKARFFNHESAPSFRELRALRRAVSRNRRSIDPRRLLRPRHRRSRSVFLGGGEPGSHGVGDVPFSFPSPSRSTRMVSGLSERPSNSMTSCIRAGRARRNSEVDSRPGGSYSRATQRAQVARRDVGRPSPCKQGT